MGGTETIESYIESNTLFMSILLLLLQFPLIISINLIPKERDCLVGQCFLRLNLLLNILFLLLTFSILILAHHFVMFGDADFLHFQAVTPGHIVIFLQQFLS